MWDGNNKKDLRKAAEALRHGELVAFPTETVYGLGANGLDPLSVAEIYRAKGRPSDNPLILHIYEKAQAYALAKEISPLAEKVMNKFWPGPLTLILPKSDCVPDCITGGRDTVAVRMPSNPQAQAILRLSRIPIAAPSANLSGRPSGTTAQHVWEDFHDKSMANLSFSFRRSIGESPFRRSSNSLCRSVSLSISSWENRS